MKLNYPVSDVKAALEENRGKHEATYEEARDEFKRQLVEKTAEVAALAVKYSIGEAKYEDYNEAMNELRRLVKPTHWLAAYDTAIAMFDGNVNDHVELDEIEYARYFLDDWEWRNQFVAQASNYTTVG